MPYEFECPYCNALLGDLSDRQGQIVTCSHCGKEITIPLVDIPVALPAGAQQPPAQAAGLVPPPYQTTVFKKHRETLILTLGLLSVLVFCCCGPFGFIPYYMGKHDLEEMDAGIMDPSGRGGTTVGKALGLLAGLVFTIIAASAVLLMLISTVYRY